MIGFHDSFGQSKSESPAPFFCRKSRIKNTPDISWRNTLARITQINHHLLRFILNFYINIPLPSIASRAFFNKFSITQSNNGGEIFASICS